MSLVSGDGRGAAAAMRLPLLVCLFAVFVAALVPFLPSLDNEMVWDDHILLENNPALLKPLRSFRTMVVMSEQQTPYYRPLSILWWSAERVLLKLDARGLHLANILLHACAALLVLLVSWRLLSPLPALLGGLLFAVHPVHLEPVSFASAGGTELLPATLFLGALWVLLPDANRRGEPGFPGRKRLWVSAGLYLCAMFSKEVAVGFPLLAGVVLLVRRPPRVRAGKVLAAGLCPFVLAGISYCVLRVGAMLSQQAALPQETNQAHAWQVPAWLLASLKALLSTSRLLPYHQLAPLSPLEYLLLGVLLAGLALAVLLLGRARRWDLPVLLGAGLLLVTLLPAAPLLPRSGALISERFLYLPSAGLSLLVGCALEVACRGGFGRRVVAALAAFVCAVVCLGAMTFIRTRDWRDDRTLFSSALARDPRNSTLLLFRGRQYLVDRQYQEAERLVKASLKLNPGQWKAKVYLGRTYTAQGRFEEAEKLYRSMLSESPYIAAMAWFELGTIKMKSGHAGDGEQEFLRAVRINPALVLAYLNLGLIAYQRRDLDLTTRYLEAGLVLEPTNPHLLNGMGMTARDRGDYQAARSYLLRALQEQPSLESARSALAGLPPDR